MSKRQSKKSENIEVRISYEDKRALYKKAKAEGRSVSAIIRALISEYLETPIHEPMNSKADIIASTLKTLFRKPKVIFTGLLAAATTSLLFIPTASANDIMLDIEGEIVRTDFAEPASISTKRIETTILVSDGKIFEMDLGSPNMTASPLDLKLRIKVEEAVPIDTKELVWITMMLIEKVEGVEKIIAEPKLKVELGTTATFVSGVEGGDMFQFKFVPNET